MEILGRKNFQFQNEKYRYVLEADKISFHLTCIKVAEKVAIDEISKDLRKAIYEQLKKQFDTSVAQNVCYGTERIDPYSRNYFNIDFPENAKEQLTLLTNELLGNGIIQLGGEEPFLKDYLEMKGGVEVFSINYDGVMHYCTNQKGMQVLLQKVKDDIQLTKDKLTNLERLHTEIFNECFYMKE